MRAFPARAIGYASAACGLQVVRATFVVIAALMLLHGLALPKATPQAQEAAPGRPP